MPLDRNLNRAYLPHERQPILFPATTGVKFFNGGLISIKGGNAQPSTSTGGFPVAGVLIEPLFPDDAQANRTCHLDNTDGADGIVRAGDSDDSERAVRADTVGIYCFRFTGTPPEPMKLAYVVDDTTLTVDPIDGGSIAGVVLRPGPDSSKVFGGTNDWWYVDIGRRSV